MNAKRNNGTKISIKTKSRDIGNTNIYEIKQRSGRFFGTDRVGHGSIIHTVISDPTSVKIKIALALFSMTRQGCMCDSKCDIDDLQDLALSLAVMDK